MDLFQLNIYANPLAYPFVIKSIKDFLNNNNLSIKKEGNLSINTYPKVSFEKHIMIETGYKKDEVKKYNVYTKELISTADNFIKNISYLNYNGGPQFFLDKMTIYKKISFYLNKFFFIIL